MLFNLRSCQVLFLTSLSLLAAAIPKARRLRTKLWFRYFSLAEHSLTQDRVKAVNGLVLFLARTLSTVALSLTMHAGSSHGRRRCPLWANDSSHIL
jgi:hypothetical protein